ncbi:MAG: hypothetical protein Q8Q20_04430 [bacterium]|nr:hypothetical protein [bacterium]
MSKYNAFNIVVASVLTLVFAFNQSQISIIHTFMHPADAEASQDSAVETEKKPLAVSSGLVEEAIAAAVPTGTPSVEGSQGVINYGAELKISYDQAAQTIPVLAPHEQDTRTEKLTGELLERYVDVGSKTSCEYCCGARTMVFPDGKKACGCAHSAAMRGLAAYLLDNYGDQLSTEQILEEVNKVKATYFPRQSAEKVIAASQGGSIDTSVLNSLSPQVGGC